MSKINFENATFLSDKEILHDGIQNLVANLGTNCDKRNATSFVNKKQLSLRGSEEELNAMYSTDWLSGKVVDIIPDDMTREWRSFSGEIDTDIVKDLEKEENRLQLSYMFNMAHKWARLYGTAFIVIAVDDGQTQDTPLDISKIKLGGLRHIKVVDRYRLNTADVVPIADPMNPNFGMPEFYRFAETSVRIHHSRLLRFDGVRTPYDVFRRNNYFSDSVLSRLYESIVNFNIAANSSASMIFEANVDVVKIKGMMNNLQTAEGTNLLLTRFSIANTMKSFNNMMMLDSEEELTSKTNSFTGLPELLDRFALYLGAASDIPATRLLGSSASGFNATGEGDLKNYYDTVRALQSREYKPKLDYFDKIMAKSLGLDDNADLEYNFNSLFQLTQKDLADLQFVNAQRDQIYLSTNVLTEEIIAKDLKQNGTYSNITEEYLETLEDVPNGFSTYSDPSQIGNEQEAQGGEQKVNSTN